MKLIQLTKGYATLVDDKNFERLMSGRRWHVSVRRRQDGTIRTVYVERGRRNADGTRSTEMMHRLVLGITDPNIQIDHEDHDGLNNQEYNLRPATYEQNGSNRVLGTNSTSGYKGVHWSKQMRKWEADVYVSGKRIYLGCFIDLLEAKAAADEGRLKHHGSFALTNSMLEERAAA